MAINKKRLQRFRAEIADLQSTLSFEEFYRTIKAKILNALSFDSSAFKELSAAQQRRFVARLFKTGQGQYAIKIFQTFDDTLDVVNTLYKDLGVDASRDFSKIVAIEKINRAELGDYGESSIKDIQTVIRKSLIDGDDVKQIARRLKTLDEKVVHYADTIARTQVKGYARLAKAEKARLAEVFLYEYTGPIIKTTRPFCLALIGKTLHIDTINKMRNGNKEPVRTYCGGWNCHHDLEPDPFAKNETVGEWQEITISGRTVKVYSSSNLGSLVSGYKQTIKTLRDRKRK